jgi:hypothetical protein
MAFDVSAFTGEPADWKVNDDKAHGQLTCGFG